MPILTRFVVTATYLSDLWLFDTETYKWKQIEIRDTDRTPGYVSTGPISCGKIALVDLTDSRDILPQRQEWLLNVTLFGRCGYPW